MFRERVRKNAQDSFEKHGFAENHHFHGTANLGYIAAVSAILRLDTETLDLLSRIQSFFIFTHRSWAEKGIFSQSSLS